MHAVELRTTFIKLEKSGGDWFWTSSGSWLSDGWRAMSRWLVCPLCGVGRSVKVVRTNFIQIYFGLLNTSQWIFVNVLVQNSS